MPGYDFRKNLTNSTDTVKPRLIPDSLNRILPNQKDTAVLPGIDSLRMKEKIDTFSI